MKKIIDLILENFIKTRFIKDILINKEILFINNIISIL
jgi:hypothetical protein